MLTAVIDPNICIGCGICLEKCPFDAIIGAQGLMHTVLVQECIGCKLCISPCPMDCIQLDPMPKELLSQKNQMIAHAKQRRTAKILRIKQEKSINLVNNEIIQQDLKNIISKDS